MSTEKILERGKVMSAVIPFGTTRGASDLGNTKQITIEPDCIVLQHGLVISTAFDGTTPTITATDGTTAYHNAVAAGATGYTAGSAGVGKYYPNGGTITVSSAGTSVTAGQAFFVITYVKAGKVDEVITN